MSKPRKKAPKTSYARALRTVRIAEPLPPTVATTTPERSDAIRPTWQGVMTVKLPPVALPPDTYLSGLRDDSMLDGLLGIPNVDGLSGGGWSNPVTGMGTFARDKVMQGRFCEPFFLDWTEISALYNGNDIAQRIVATVPRETFRRGYILVVPQDDAGEKGGKASDTEAPVGFESGPAAPGAPLVDPMGAATPGTMSANAPQPSTTIQPIPLVAPPEAKAAESDPMGERLALGAEPPQPPQAGASTSGKPAKAGKQTPAGNIEGQNQGADMALQIQKYANTLCLNERMLEADIFGRAYGGGILIVGADDGQAMDQPLDENNIKSIRFLTWIDRRFVFASTWYANIGPKYGEVETWEVVNPFGGAANTRLHESRVVKFEGSPVDFLMRRRLLGWSLSVLQAPYDTMRQFDQSFQSIANLMADMSQAVMKINGLAQLISNDQETLQTRMAMVDRSRSSGRMIYLDAENEEFKREPTPLTGVADTLEMQMLRLAAAAEQPVAILFGREPSGLNATGDADFRRFYDTIAGRQLTYTEPRILRVFKLICLAKDSPTGGNMPSNGVSLTWHKLYEPSEKEQSEIRLNMAQADALYVTNQVLLPEEVAQSRFRDGDLHLDTEIQKTLREDKLKTAELPPSGAEKFKAEQDTQKQGMAIKAAAVAAKGAKPGTPPPAKG